MEIKLGLFPLILARTGSRCELRKYRWVGAEILVFATGRAKMAFVQGDQNLEIPTRADL